MILMTVMILMVMMMDWNDDADAVISILSPVVCPVYPRPWVTSWFLAGKVPCSIWNCVMFFFQSNPTSSSSHFKERFFHLIPDRTWGRWRRGWCWQGSIWGCRRSARRRRWGWRGGGASRRAGERGRRRAGGTPAQAWTESRPWKLSSPSIIIMHIVHHEHNVWWWKQLVYCKIRPTWDWRWAETERERQ